MSFLDARHRYIINKVREAFDFEDVSVVENFLSSEINLPIINAFLSGEGPPKLIVSCTGLIKRAVPSNAQNGTKKGKDKHDDEEGSTSVINTARSNMSTASKMSNVTDIDHDLQPALDGQSSQGTPILSLISNLNETVFINNTNPCVYFLRNTNSIDVANVENEISFGEVFTGSALESLDSLLGDVYYQILNKQDDWGKNTEDNTKDFLQEMGKFVGYINQTVSRMNSGVELRKPDFSKLLGAGGVKNSINSLSQFLQSPDLVVPQFEELLDEWCVITEKILKESESTRKEVEEVGPNSELEFWRTRQARLNSIQKQLSTRECKLVLGVLTASKVNDSKAIRRWKALDLAITDAINETKDTVKYLTTLEKYTVPLYTGTPVTILDALPSLMNNLKMIHAISRYYSVPERMTPLLVKITNQMITNCKQYIKANGKIWDQKPEFLIPRLQQCLNLYSQYQEQYNLVYKSKDSKESTMNGNANGSPNTKKWDTNETQIFSRFKVFSARLEKLSDLFMTISQFSNLTDHKLDGMVAITNDFLSLVAQFKQRSYDITDTFITQFDKDYAEFNKSIILLEGALQDFINLSFDRASDTQEALKLLKQYQLVFQRESLRADLDSKYQVIFHNYGLDLSFVKDIYELHKLSPSLVRNAPPISGNIAWSRLLLRKIEDPMNEFKTIKSLIQAPSARHIIRTYNKVAKALVKFEILWQDIWFRSLETAKAGLSATLLVRHPETGQIYVNIDKDILHTFREAKWMLRLGGVPVPDAARTMLLQEDKFRRYIDHLAYLLREYHRINTQIRTVLKPLFVPAFEDIDYKLLPGLTKLTWTSLNIDAYIQKVSLALSRLEELVVKVNDIIDQRVTKNLDTAKQIILLNLNPTTNQTINNTNNSELNNTQMAEKIEEGDLDSPQFSLEDFINTQASTIREKSTFLGSQGAELESSINELLTHIRQYNTHNVDYCKNPITEDDLSKVKNHYQNCLLEAVKTCIKNSLYALLHRLTSNSTPLFEIDVMLIIPDVTTTPSLEDLKAAILNVATETIKASDSVNTFRSGAFQNGIETERKRSSTLFNSVASDPFVIQISQDVLLNTFESIQSMVEDYTEMFKSYEYLWVEDMQGHFSSFLKSHPTLEHFEVELEKYQVLERQINQISSYEQIGAISLCSTSLKYSLKAEVTAWKIQYAKHLQDQVREHLTTITEYVSSTRKKLIFPINDIDDLRGVMNTLKDIIYRETDMERLFLPVEDTLELLKRYDVRVNTEDLEMVNTSNTSWVNLKKQAQQIADDLGKVQLTFRKNLISNIKALGFDIKNLIDDYNSNGPMVTGIKPTEAVDRLRKFQRLYQEHAVKYNSYQAGEELFGLPKTEYSGLMKMKSELDLLDSLYSLYLEVTSTIEEYTESSWSHVSPMLEVVSSQLTQYHQQCSKLPKALRSWDAYTDLRSAIDKFLEIIPLLKNLASKYVKSRHWQKVMEVSNNATPRSRDMPRSVDSMKLSQILSMNLLSYKEDVEEILNAAEKESRIEQKLTEIQEQWSEQVFTFTEFKHRGPVILKGQETEQIMDLLEESQTALSAMMSSRYIGPFKEEVQNWLSKLGTVGETIDQWLIVQSMWIYLEAVFSSSTISKQLPQEAKRFQLIDKNWIKIMTKAYEVRNVLVYTNGNDQLRQLLQNLTEQLELCQKSLSGYLETKRVAFPRFYFVSDTVLLEILSQKNDPKSIQPHLKSIFDALHSVGIEPKQRKLLSMQSGEGETVDFSSPVVADGNIEDWLALLETEMKRTIKDIIRKVARECFTMKLTEFVEKYPSQAVLLGLQFIFTRDTQLALSRSRTEKGTIQSTFKRVNQTLSDLTQMAARELSPLDRMKLETLITVQVHQRDVMEELILHKVKDPQDFEWQRQCRVFWRTDKDECCIEVADIEFDYGYEYLGCKERLVITPLTDRCYIALTQALAMFMGGSPFGPAGTGKTETVKDLGRTLGKYVVVINASDQYNYLGLGKIFKGTSQSGAWVCFDEFNRIDVEVLSVVAQQIHCIFSAMRERKKQFVFTDGSTLTLNPTAGVFVTFNPGYAGRQELPENIKSQFRGVSMMVPDRDVIMKVKLASQGFHEAPILAKKFDVMYKLCEEQLSKQPHYDFGLRNILSVLRTAGIKRRSRKGTEAYALVSALRSVNLPKLVAEDASLFSSLLDDLFPGQTQEKTKYPEIRSAIELKLKEEGLINYSPWVDKVIELYEASQVRHGIIVVGPPCVGKTKCIDILIKSLSTSQEVYKLIRMNPKAITTSQMYGSLDVANEWTDGIFSSIWRRVNRQKNAHTWICLDGPVDAMWIESLNSVLDENKTLTLSNGDRLPMMSNVRLVFEVADLNNASPATVSRAGIIYMSPSVLGWTPIVESWLSTRRLFEVQPLRQLFEKYIDLCFNFIKKECHPIIQTCQVNQVTTCFHLISALLEESVAQNETVNNSQLDRIFIFSVVWSLGALLNTKDRVSFSDFIHKNWASGLPLLNENYTIYDYYVNEGSLDWALWTKKVPAFKYPKGGLEFTKLVVPTVDTVRTQYLIELIVRQKKGVLLVGEPGSSKSLIIRQYLSQKVTNTSSFSKKSITFSAATTPLVFQKFIETSLEKRQGRTYGPLGGANFMGILIDDLNTPEINEWGDQETSELLRQLIEDQGFYNLEKPGEWLSITGLQFIGTMTQPNGDQNDLPDRLKRHFAMFGLPLPNDSTLDTIFGGILRGHFSNGDFAQEVANQARSSIIPLTLDVWNRVRKSLLPTPGKTHYIFNLRELSRVIQGILRCPPEILNKPKTLYSLWKHECMRVFGDKLTTPEDHDWLESELSKALDRIAKVSSVQQSAELSDYFTDFLRFPTKDDTGDEVVNIDIKSFTKIYEPVSSWAQLKEQCEKYMRMYNDKFILKKLDLVMFEDAVRHLMRISRILMTPRGNALLVGVGGSGKQSLTKLASFISGYTTVQLAVNKSYGVQNLLEDLKRLYRITGAQGLPVTFILTDNDIKQDAFLDYINQLLSSGEIPNLFAKEELDMAIAEMKAALKDDSSSESFERYYVQFLDRVRDNLHVVLCFSPGEKFRQRIRKFPCLISQCIVDWFLPWPVDALTSVAQRHLDDFTKNISSDSISTLLPKVQTIMANTHATIEKLGREYFHRYRRHVYVTPRSFLNFIQSFKQIYLAKFEEISSQVTKLNLGLEKLRKAGEDVGKMKEVLFTKEQALEQAQKISTDLLNSITASTAKAEKKKAEIVVLKNQLAENAAIVASDHSNASKDLEESQPELEKAMQQVKLIKSKDIVLLRGLKNPPDLVKRIVDSIMIMKSFGPLEPVTVVEVQGRRQIKDSWPMAQLMMVDSHFLGELLNFDTNSLNDETLELLQPYLEMKDFTYEDAKRNYNSVAALLLWVKAQLQYRKVSKDIAPKMAALQDATYRLRVAKKQLAVVQSELDAQQAELNNMKKEFDLALQERQKVQDEAEYTRSRMEAANSLIKSLAEEKVRWSKQSSQFKEILRETVGNATIASAFVSYCGPFNKEFRDKLVQIHFFQECKRLGVPVTDPDSNETESLLARLQKFLVDDAIVGEWLLQGLPTDSLSVQNGMITTKSNKWPVIIDPQGQGRNWIVRKEKQNGLVIIKMEDKYILQHLEDCLSNGKPLLIELTEEDIDPLLDPLLEKQFVKSGRSYKIFIADKEIDYSENFRLYITTRMSNPHFSPELCAKTTVIDFTVTQSGLESQLLGHVVLKERAALEEQRYTLLQEINQNQKSIVLLQDDLLETLSKSEGNLLDNSALISVLANTKKGAEEVKEKLQIASETEKKISLAREEYRPVALRGSVLYFLMQEINLVNHMYHTSLSQFMNLFDQSIRLSEKHQVPSKRINNIIDHLTYSASQYSMRGLFQKHRQVFLLLLAIKVPMSCGEISPEEFSIFVKGGASLDIQSAIQSKPREWIEDKAWCNVLELSKLSSFRHLPEMLQKNEQMWKAWYELEAPESKPLPDGLDQRYSKFQRLLLIRCLREDRTMVASSSYIAETLGTRYIEPVALNLDGIVQQESTSRTPVIFLLSAGSEPSSLIDSLSRKRKKELKYISMGQGQEIQARRLISEGMKSGGWVLLQNCHLGLKFLPEVELTLTKTPEEEMNPEFRLFITTEPHPKFPVAILQNSLKLTNETDAGLKAGLKRCFNWVNQDLLDCMPRKEWIPMLYMMCFLHTVVQERRKFGPLGWNVPYEFNQTDLETSVQFLQNQFILTDFKKGGLSWTTLRYMICEVMYGGKISDRYDRRLFSTFGNFWIGPQIFEKTFFFQGSAYNIPQGQDIQTFRNAIEKLPLFDPPELFGLHPNADIMYRTKQSQQVLLTILDIQPKDNISSGEMTSQPGGKGRIQQMVTRESQVLAITEDLLGKLPVDFQKDTVLERIRKLGGYSPLNIFLSQEIDALQSVVNLVRSTLSELKLAIAGTITMSATSQEVLTSLYDSRVPSLWGKISWHSPSLPTWFSDLIARKDQLNKWLSYGPPAAFWLGGLFNPNGFFTAVKQEAARGKNLALDTVVLQTTVINKDRESIREPPIEGVYIYGLYLEGAGWSKNKSCLVEAQSKALFTPLPVIHITAVSEKNIDPNSVYSTPCYKNPLRTERNFIFDVDLKTEEDPSKWALRGVALTCTDLV